MAERSIVITVKEEAYEIHSSLLNEFELLGLLEQIVFDLKSSKQKKPQTKNDSEQKVSGEAISAAEPAPDSSAVVLPGETNKETTTAKISNSSSSASKDLRTRIGNAIKAIRDLGGKVEVLDLSQMSDAELQNELDGLTAQYKSLKNSRGK